MDNYLYFGFFENACASRQINALLHKRFHEALN